VSGTDLKQRLAAILAADVAGYSRLMAVDERATVAALDAARKVFRSHVESSQGRVIDMAGDSVLAVFETATGAVSAALAIQKGIHLSGESAAEHRRMRFRIGIHLGDVIEKTDGTIYGDGVNIAARLEGLAEPGGITVSESIRTAVKGRIGAEFEDQGEQRVKNITEPVRAYRVRAEGAVASRAASSIGEIDLSLPDKPSIAVLPFANMSGDPEQEYFTDGITEDIITELSRFHSLFVIARNSSFTYKGKAVDVRTVAEGLGVRYVLKGSIRRSANRIRVTAQLIDALTGNHIWAERYDRVLEDIFAVQEEVTRAIVAAIAPHIETSEAARSHSARPGNFSAYEIAMRAWATAQSSFGEGEHAAREEALRLSRKALLIDPRCGAALRTIAFARWQQIYLRTTASVAEAHDEGLSAATRAIAIDSGDHAAHLWKGTLLFNAGQQYAGLADARRAYELNPNDSLTLASLGFFEAMCGDALKGIEYIANALRLSPRDPSRYVYLNYLGWAHFAAANYEKGSEAAQRSIGEAPKMAAPHLCLVVSWIALAEFARAKTEFQVVRDLAPNLVEARLAVQWLSPVPEFRRRATTFLRIAAGLEDPSAAEALR